MKKRPLRVRVTRADLMPWLGGMAAVVMLGVMAWVGAEIFWTLKAPESASPSALRESDPQRAAQNIGKRHLFGTYVAAVAVAAAPSTIRLNGVIAGQRPGQRAYALLTVEGKAAQLVREGEEIAPGITLQRVLARQVEVTRGGQSQTLNLPETSKSDNPKTGESNKAATLSPPALENPKAPVILPPNTPVTTPANVPAAITQAVPASAPPLPKRRKTRRSTEDDT